jgi:hypothetical protein
VDLRPELFSPPLDLAVARTRLLDLRVRSRVFVGVAAVLAAAAVAALKVGGLGLFLLVGVAAVVVVVGVWWWRADYKQLLTCLVAQGDAGSLPEVRAWAEHLDAQRSVLARGFRRLCGRRSGLFSVGARFNEYEQRLLGLASALEDRRVPIKSTSLALASRLLHEPSVSPLYNRELPVEELDHALEVIERGVGSSPG